MFTGIIEHVGQIESLSLHGDGGKIVVHAPTVAPSLAVSNSIAVNGCCLTVTSIEKECFSADLSVETIQRTSFGAKHRPAAINSFVNLEQPLTAGKEFGGHFVLGHIDAAGEIAHLRPEGENWNLGVKVPPEFARYIVPKGSITVDGISLTVAKWHASASVESEQFIVEVAIIPYTYRHTNLCHRQPGDAVNLEGDILGKYVERHLEARASGSSKQKLSIEELVQQGF
jgi:riboflavin synthase